MRSVGLAAACAALLAPTAAAAAQSLFDSEVRFAPQYMQYRLNAPSNETISQLAIPLFVSIPVSPRLTLDVGTSYAHSLVTGDAGRSELRGLTDTQLRGNLTLGTDYIVLTLGLNLPTGKSGVTLDEFAAASRIGNDFLAFPIANMGTGFAGTGGIAVARPLGDWNVGFGAAVRRATSYEPFNIPNQSMRFQPGNEYRLRLGVDRTMGAGRLALGLTFSKFGEDDAGGSRFRTGSRMIGQSVYNGTLGGNDFVVGAYDVFRSAGEFASGGTSGRENVANLFGTIGLHPNGQVVEPTLEIRQWMQEIPGFTVGTVTTESRTQNSLLGTLGVRTRLALGGVTVFPGVGFTVGRLALTDETGAVASAGLTGFKAQIAMRATPFAGP
jgi:hypothetical protein